VEVDQEAENGDTEGSLVHLIFMHIDEQLIVTIAPVGVQGRPWWTYNFISYDSVIYMNEKC